MEGTVNVVLYEQNLRIGGYLATAFLNRTWT
jgi:hypothetical protein